MTILDGQLTLDGAEMRTCPSCGGRGVVAVAAPEQIREPLKARRSDPATSRRAGLENLPRRRNQHRRILDDLARHCQERTAEQIADAADLRLNSVSTRMAELVRSGWVEVVGTESGRRQLYRITVSGHRRYLEQT